MANFIQGTQLRTLLKGTRAVKASGAISGNPTTSMFTVAGGTVLLTGLWLEVTTSITTNGGTLAINNVPTTGNTMTLVTATDLGTTDTVAGSVVGLDRGTTAAPSFLVGGRVDINAIATTGVINIIGASSANGAVNVVCTWIPLTDGATLVAS